MLLRLVLIPAIGIAVFAVAKAQVPWLVGDRLTQLVCMVQFGCTSSQSAVVVAQAYGSQRTAGVLAYLYVFQYCASIVTVTAVTLIAMHIASW